MPVDVNASDAETLKQLPGVTDEVAVTLIGERPFASNAAFLDRLAELAPDADLQAASSYLAAE